MTKKQRIFAQCKYERSLEDGTKRVDITWIPVKFAKVGKKVYFGKKKQDVPQIWTVIEVWSKRPESYLLEHERDFMDHRDFSDI